MFTTEWDGVKLMGIGSEITGMWKECTETVETGKDEGKLLSSRAINQPQNSSIVACLLPHPDKKTVCSNLPILLQHSADSLPLFK